MRRPYGRSLQHKVRCRTAASLDATDACGSPDVPENVNLPQAPLDPAQTPLPPSPPPPRHPSRPAIPSQFKPGQRPQDGRTSSHPSSSSSLPRRPSHHIPKAPVVEVELPQVTSSSSASQLAIPPRARRKSEPNVKARGVAMHPPAPDGVDAPAKATASVNTPANEGPPRYLNGRKKYIAREHIFAKQVS